MVRVAGLGGTVLCDTTLYTVELEVIWSSYYKPQSLSRLIYMVDYTSVNS